MKNLILFLLTIGAILILALAPAHISHNNASLSYSHKTNALSYSLEKKRKASPYSSLLPVRPGHAKLPPQPVEIVKDQENEEKEKNARDEWFNNMHRIAPGINWRLMDELTRYEKSPVGALPLNKVDETFANGNLKGAWIEKGSNNQAGRIVLSEVDTVHNYIYAASAGGNIWVGNMDGSNWHCLNNNFKFSGICMLRILQKPSVQRILVATNNNTFYYSDDYGKNWIKASGLENAQKWGYGAKAIMTNDSLHSIYYLLQEWDYLNYNAVVSIYLSKDNGISFKKIISYKDLKYYSTDRSDIWTDYYGSSNAYFLKDSALFKIKPGDSSLTTVSTIPWKTRGSENITGTEKGGKTYLYTMIDTFIFYSNNAGATWVNKGHLNENRYTKWSFHCSSQYPDILHIGYVNCLRSLNKGASWNFVNQWYDYYPSPQSKLHADIQSIQSFRQAGGIFYTLIGNDGGLYKGNDSITTVKNIGMSGLKVSQYYSTLTKIDSASLIYAGSQDQGFQRAVNDSAGFVNFEQVVSGDYGHLSSGDGGASLWMIYPSFADFYPDAVNSKTEHSWYWSNLKTQPLWMAPLIAAPSSSYQAYVAAGSSTTGSHIFTLTYNTSTSSISATEDTFDFSRNKMGNISALGISQLNFNNRYVATENGGFYYSYDGGKSWTLNNSFTAPGPQYFYGACILPSSKKSGRLWISGSGYSSPAVFVSDDSGRSFKAVTTGLPHTLVTGLATDTSETFLFAATSVGPYVLNISEGKWYDLKGSFAPDQVYWSVEFVPSLNTARYSTYGRGIWDFKIEAPARAAIETGHQAMHTGLRIFPNPCHDYINFEYDLTKAAKVRVELNDAYGRRLIEKSYNSLSGTLKAKLDLSGFTKGTYFLNISTPEHQETKAFIVQ